MQYSKHGFTLIELIIVCVIIGILAAVVAPMMSGMKARAICAEGVTGMSAIRTAFRAYYSECGSYPLPASPLQVRVTDATLAARLESAGLNIDSLNGTYFDKYSYIILFNGSNGDPDTAGWNQNRILCLIKGAEYQGATPIAPKYSEAASLGDDPTPGNAYLVSYISNGKIRQQYLKQTGYRELVS